MVEGRGGDGQHGRARLAVVDRGDRVRPGNCRRADIAAARAVGRDRQGCPEREVAQRVARGVEPLHGVRLRASRADRCRGRADHDLIERPSRNLQ